MNSITKLSVFVGVLATIAFAFGVFALFSPTAEKISGVFAPVTALAFGTSGCGDCGSTPTWNPQTQPGGSNPFSTPTQHPAVCKVKLSKSTVEYGGSVVIDWKTSNAQSVKLSGYGDVPKNNGGFGNHTRTAKNLTKDTTYTLTVKGDDGKTITCKETVKVEKKPEPKDGKCVAFTANKSTLPYGGGNVKLSWNTKNANKVTIDNNVGTVSANGTHSLNVTKTTTFTLTVKADGQDDTCKVTVKVGDKPADKTPSCDYFQADPDKVDEGDTFKLTWGTTNAKSVSINNGVGTVAKDGSLTLTADSDSTYTLTVTGVNNDTVTCKTSVDVDPDEEEESPHCDLNISDRSIDEGDKVTLDWDNDNVEDILLKDDHGNVLVDTDDGDDYDEERDEITVKPREDTEYRLTVYGTDGSKRTCEVDVEVDEDEDDDDVYYSSYRDQQPLIAGIALAQVPYTGFEAGTALTALFYTLLALWGIAVAYILVVKKGSILGFALAGTASKVAPATAVAMAAGSHTLSTATPSVPVNLPTAPVSFAPVQNEEEVEGVTEDLGATMLEQHAQESRVLLSSDAIHFIVAQAGTMQAQINLLNMAITSAKASFPTEDGWLVLNKERMLQLFR